MGNLVRVLLGIHLVLGVQLFPTAGAAVGHFEEGWTFQDGSTGSDRAFAIAADVTGNTFVTGWTMGLLAGSHAGLRDVYVVSLNSSGAVRWRYQVGSTVDDYGNAIAVAADGSVYVAGSTRGSLFGSHSGSGSEYDAILLKLNAVGSFIWGRQFGVANSQAVIKSVSIVPSSTSSHAVVVCGDTWGDLFSPSQGGYDWFVASYSALGTRQWAKQRGSYMWDFALALHTDRDAIYVAGETDGNLVGTNSGTSYDAFAYKLSTANGAVLWSFQGGSSLYDGASAIVSDGVGGAFLAGDTLGDFALAHKRGGYDIFVLKLNPDGTEAWRYQTGSLANEYVMGITWSLGSQVVYVAGQTSGNMGAMPSGGIDGFVVALSSSGTPLGRYQFGSLDNDWLTSIAQWQGNHVFISGTTDGILKAGRPNPIGQDIFVRQLTFSENESICVNFTSYLPFTGGVSNITVRAGAGAALHLKLWGGAGGGGQYSSNNQWSGAGGFTSAVMQAKGIFTLNVKVGGGGKVSSTSQRNGWGGWPDGGIGQGGDVRSGGGGGSTSVWRSNAVLAVAGGGGGSAGYIDSGGAGGGSYGQDAGRARGANPQSGGINPFNSQLNGASFQGGQGGTSASDDGAGGGGGYFGGAGGGGDGHSGGGGSGYIAANLLGSSFTGNGHLVHPNGTSDPDYPQNGAGSGVREGIPGNPGYVVVKVLCPSQGPTSAPTSAPSPAPTSAPTPAPTPAPTSVSTMPPASASSNTSSRKLFVICFVALVVIVVCLLGISSRRTAPLYPSPSPAATLLAAYEVDTQKLPLWPFPVEDSKAKEKTEAQPLPETRETGMAFSGGGVRSAAFSAGVLRCLLEHAQSSCPSSDEKDIERHIKQELPRNLACVSGGGYTGASFLHWLYTNPLPLKSWYPAYFDNLQQQCGYLVDTRLDCQSWGFVSFLVLLVLQLCVVVLTLCPAMFPLALLVDHVYGDILRETNGADGHLVAWAVATGVFVGVQRLAKLGHTPAHRFLQEVSCVLVFLCGSVVTLLYAILAHASFSDTKADEAVETSVIVAFGVVPSVMSSLTSRWTRLVVWGSVLTVAARIAYFKIFADGTLLFGIITRSDKTWDVLYNVSVVIIALHPILLPSKHALVHAWYRWRLTRAFFYQGWQRFNWGAISTCLKYRGFEGGRTWSFSELRARRQSEPWFPRYLCCVTANRWSVQTPTGKRRYSPLVISPEGFWRPDAGSWWRTTDDMFPGTMEVAEGMTLSASAVAYGLGRYGNLRSKQSRVDHVLSGVSLGSWVRTGNAKCSILSIAAFVVMHIGFVLLLWLAQLTPALTMIAVLPPVLLLIASLAGSALPAVEKAGTGTVVHRLLQWANGLLEVMVLQEAFELDSGVWPHTSRGRLQPAQQEQEQEAQQAQGQEQDVLIGGDSDDVVLVPMGMDSARVVEEEEKRPALPRVLSLSDGGHTDNFGLLALLHRRCAVMYIADATCDPTERCDEFRGVLSLAREFLACAFVPHPDDPSSTGNAARDVELAFTRFAQSRHRVFRFLVRYAATASTPASTGLVLYLKPRKESLDDADNAEDLHGMCSHCCHTPRCWPLNLVTGVFPHHATSCQFFTPRLFSAYSQRGFEAMQAALQGNSVTE